jgi:hypothetical protein
MVLLRGCVEDLVGLDEENGHRTQQVANTSTLKLNVPPAAFFYFLFIFFFFFWEKNGKKKNMSSSFTPERFTVVDPSVLDRDEELFNEDFEPSPGPWVAVTPGSNGTRKFLLMLCILFTLLKKTCKYNFRGAWWCFCLFSFSRDLFQREIDEPFGQC